MNTDVFTDLYLTQSDSIPLLLLNMQYPFLLLTCSNLGKYQSFSCSSKHALQLFYLFSTQVFLLLNVASDQPLQMTIQQYLVCNRRNDRFVPNKAKNYIVSQTSNTQSKLEVYLVKTYSSYTSEKTCSPMDQFTALSTLSQ